MTGTNELSIPFYLTSVFGGAYVLFQVPEDVDYRPWIGNKWQTVDLSSSSNTLYARVPVDYILDVVECGTKQSDLSGKRVPGISGCRDDLGRRFLCREERGS